MTLIRDLAVIVLSHIPHNILMQYQFTENIYPLLFRRIYGKPLVHPKLDKIPIRELYILRVGLEYYEVCEQIWPMVSSKTAIYLALVNHDEARVLEILKSSKMRKIVNFINAVLYFAIDHDLCQVVRQLLQLSPTNWWDACFTIRSDAMVEVLINRPKSVSRTPDNIFYDRNIELQPPWFHIGRYLGPRVAELFSSVHEAIRGAIYAGHGKALMKYFDAADQKYYDLFYDLPNEASIEEKVYFLNTSGITSLDNFGGKRFNDVIVHNQELDFTQLPDFNNRAQKLLDIFRNSNLSSIQFDKFIGQIEALLNQIPQKPTYDERLGIDQQLIKCRRFDELSEDSDGYMFIPREYVTDHAMAVYLQLDSERRSGTGVLVPFTLEDYVKHNIMPSVSDECERYFRRN